jgi:hypothetical protein
MTTRERIESQLRERVCANCYALTRSGECNLRNSQQCPLFAHLDQVIELVSGVRDYSLDPYQDRIRSILCTHCTQRPNGHCERRDRLDCALEVYFPLIVEIVEKELYDKAT